MACYHPLKAFRPLSKADGGRLVFDSKLALNPHHHIVLPCGGCIGCRLDKSGDWSMRCVHEAAMHDRNCFVTLTYNDEHLPEDYSVNVRHCQLFMKKLRKKYGSKIRFYLGAEYGSENRRPHYHLILFNHDFDDKVFHSTNKEGDRLYSSESLDEVWGKASIPNLIGDVTYQSAGYCAQYTMKKITGDRALTHYLYTHPVNGLVVSQKPEFSLMSRRPGIGDMWFQKFRNDCFPSDFLVVDGKQRRVPPYYLRKLEKERELNPPPEPAPGKYLTTLAKEEITKLKRARTAKARPRKWDNTKERLAVREEIKQSRIKRKPRSL